MTGNDRSVARTLHCSSGPLSGFGLAGLILLLALLGFDPSRATGAIQFEYAQYSAGEATEFVSVAVVRNPGASNRASVDFNTAAQTATAGLDYTETHGVLNFAPGEVLQLIKIPILNDGARELGERFQVRLSNATGDELGSRDAATVTITDNDPGVKFATRELWFQEDAGGIELKVLRGNDRVLDPFTIDYLFTNSTATVGEDFHGRNGTLHFAAGELSKSIRIPVANDRVSESDEQFQVLLRNPSSGIQLGALSMVTVTIVDATGMEARRFNGIHRQKDGSLRLELSGSFSQRFLTHYSLFQIESSTDLKTWNCLPLMGHPNRSTNAPFLMLTNGAMAGGQFYRLMASPLITPLPPPTGPHAVGVTKRLMLDPNRRNRYGISTGAVFVANIWYPADPIPGRIPDPFVEPELLTAESGAAILMDRVPRFLDYATRDLPLSRPSGAGWPIVLYSHGGAAFRWQGSAICQNLASHGYVAVSVDHFDAFVVLLPNGEIYATGASPSFTVANSADRVRDLVVTLDELEKMDREDPLFRAGLDLDRIASVGFSWGASTAAELCRTDSRCQATASLDWGVGTTGGFPDLARSGVLKPSLMLNASDNLTSLLFTKAERDAYWIEISNTVHGDFALAPWLDNNNAIPSLEAARTIQAYVVSFFHRYLKGEDDHLLDGPSPQYPRVSVFRKK